MLERLTETSDATTAMNPKLERLKAVLRPVSNERAAEIARGLAGPKSHERLTLEDAGVADEVRQFIDAEHSGHLKNLQAD